MHRPDTIIEIHRERVQDQTVVMFGGDKYTEVENEDADTLHQIPRCCGQDDETD